MRHVGDDAGADREDHDAAYLERQSDRQCDPLLAAGAPLLRGNSGEVVVAPAPEFGPDVFQKVVQQPPDMLAAEASEQRMMLTSSVSEPALTLALELGESIGAQTALERNLVHQMAAAHVVGTKMLAQANAFLALVVPWASEERQQTQSIEAARMARAAARLLECSQRAALTLDRLRNGGRQTVTVQHVTVQEGRQAVVAGTLKRGRGVGSERPSPAPNQAAARRADAGGAGAVSQGGVEAWAPQRRGHRRAKAARPGAADRRKPQRADPRGGSRMYGSGEGCQPG
ncbi:hypothetical protein [Falsiroseomonas sp. E2-1-a20]|uniref:hypothetical protein n=1 Tax=Falsiroseomonas sp. E2-1-a20 TaxID=3239300 RepID=UPI003F2CD649